MTDSDFHDADDRSARLFDLRLIIGGMFTLYGAVLTVVGLADSDAELAKAGGIRINLWIGLGMLLLGLLFLLWARWRPLRLEERSAAARAGGADEAEPDRSS
jgi:ABC-type branched-subunit amino acid transport system permease subunit